MPKKPTKIEIAEAYRNGVNDAQRDFTRQEHDPMYSTYNGTMFCSAVEPGQFTFKVERNSPIMPIAKAYDKGYTSYMRIVGYQ